MTGPLCRKLIIKGPLSGKLANLRDTFFVDDIATKTACTNPIDLKTGLHELNRSLDEALTPFGPVQNLAEQVHVPVFCGKGANASSKFIFGEKVVLPGVVAREGRYLGSSFASLNRTHFERTKRLSAIRLGWVMMRGFWAAKTIPFRVKRIVFRSKIQEAGLSGLEAFVLSDTDDIALDRAILFYDR
jgi:hypothetical protein